MSTSSPGPHLRYSELKGWLREWSSNMAAILLANGVIKRHTCMRTAYYNAVKTRCAGSLDGAAEFAR
jgi:hypothetical protein